jgi:restriction system protein
MAQASRERERQQRAVIRAEEQAVRARDQAQRAAIAARAAGERDARRLHAQAREDEAAAREAELNHKRSGLERILEATLDVDDYIDLDMMKQTPKFPRFDRGKLAKPTVRPNPGEYVVAPLGFVAGLVPGAKLRHEQLLATRSGELEKATRAWETAEVKREKALKAAEAAFQVEVEEIRAKAAAQNAEIDVIKAELDEGKPETVRNYFEMVLTGSAWPDGFPQRVALAYDATSKLLAVDYMLPDWSIVPDVKSFRYVKARDAIDSSPESAAKRGSLYSSVVAQSALRVLHEVFEADRRGQIETLALNCLVNTIDRATGTPEVPCILSVRTTAQVFRAINLRAVDPTACLKGLSASMSPSPADLAPVRPVLELKMVDHRFIQEADVLSQLDTRPNLMELSPSEFESLITNLFTKMGLETRQTQASRDGGVDCVAYDPRPIFGGKVVIQAKRYKNTVGVSAVRDLFGTMQNEGASKGILVTTSGYGSASFQFAEGKPLELLSGANLLYLLSEYAHIEARIIVPDEWRDPVADATSTETAVVHATEGVPSQA